MITAAWRSLHPAVIAGFLVQDSAQGYNLYRQVAIIDCQFRLDRMQQLFFGDRFTRSRNLLLKVLAEQGVCADGKR